MRLDLQLPSDSFLEYAFLRWVLSPIATPGLASQVAAQSEIRCGDRTYRADYEIRGVENDFVIELDGFEFHGSRSAFTYDRLRQNELLAAGKRVLRFTYDAIRLQTATCGRQLSEALSSDPLLRTLIEKEPIFGTPDMDPDPMLALGPSPARSARGTNGSYFDAFPERLNHSTLRECQREAFAALTSYFSERDGRAACVMSVGAGKTVLGVVAALAFAKRRALIVTPGNVIRGTFDRALDHQAVGNALYGLPDGPLTPGLPPPNVLTLDRDAGTVRGVTRDQLLAADIIVTNFHSLGTGADADDLLSKLAPEDVDFIVVDEAHIAASESYARAFAHFGKTKALLMSACFQRLDGRPIDADVVYRYRLIDSIADGNAKSPRIFRFDAEATETVYELRWPDGAREEIRGREALLEVMGNERKIADITARSSEPIRQVMRTVRERLLQQRELLHPVKPRVLFSALGERHAEQIAALAEEQSIPCSYLHHSMSEARVRSVRQRFESDSGDLTGIVQLKMLGQGYDFPPICVVVPMRPYGSFAEFYQFIGRGIRVVSHAALAGRVGPEDQFLDVVFHAEMGLDGHIATICEENDMDPSTVHSVPDDWRAPEPTGTADGSNGAATAERPEMLVLFERGTVVERMVHDRERVERRRDERRREALAQRYSLYAQGTAAPVSFEQFEEIMRAFGE